MADYKDIVGTAVRNNAGNLSDDQKDQIFYDSTNLDFKYQFEATADAWRTSVPLNNGRHSNIGAGSTTAVTGGSSSPDIANACVPEPAAPPRALLAVFKSFTSVHVTPLHSSVLPTLDARGLPPNPKAAVLVPQPDI